MTKLDKAKATIDHALIDMDAIDRITDEAGVHRFSLLRDELLEAKSALEAYDSVKKPNVYHIDKDGMADHCGASYVLLDDIQQYAESYHERRLKEAQAIMDAEPRGMIASGIPGPMSLDAQLRRCKAAKIAVLEEAREVFNNLDEMNPTDYSDSFDVINTLIEDIKKGK
jgi:hypothetical protein